MKKLPLALSFGASAIALASFFFWLAFYLRGRQFALRERLHRADAIVVLAGTRGNIKFLQGKIATAVRLYQKGWAPRIICSGKFSVKVTETPTLIPMSELQAAVGQGRIQEKDVAPAAKSWDVALGACYMCEQAVQMGVPRGVILVENESLHTKENAEMVLALAKKHKMRRIILVTSPFHQRRTYLTFAKVFQSHGVEILNYYADTGEWHPATWFLSTEHRKLVRSEEERIKKYRAKGDLL
ncbi:YdcF family protein [Ktedonosporobacter rubrisoli]|uniref:YdcF family protein n=1 Tax=Ktedonosporobacter rubrisoli TaxID=2509675 RepID=A0A4P6K3U6_KTERU|nr:YdcF family protein [Ktedonosporobacter rubrisoli]QBD82593.1 YdcF family protein [Ktedonosporobacter rubrisoli]